MPQLQALRKRGTPGSSSPDKRQQRRRVSIKKDRRRVSFAPDPELTMIHMFEKVSDAAMAHGARPGPTARPVCRR